MFTSFGLIEINVNSLVDALLCDIVKWINIDVLDLPDFREIIKPPSTNHFRLSNGCATNLNDISRAGDSKIFYQNRSVTIQTGICLNKLKFSYDYELRWLLSSSGNIKGNIQKVQIRFKITLKNLLIELEKVDVTVEHVALKIKSDDIFWEWFGKLMLTKIIRKKIKRIIEKKVRYFLPKLIDKVNNLTVEFRSQILETNFVRKWIIRKLANLTI